MLDLKFSPDGTRLATCSRDMSILVYAIEEIPTGAPPHQRQEGRRQHEAAKGETDMEVEEEEGGEDALPRPLGYGRLGVRLAHRLQRSATASVCRLFW